MTEIFSIGFGLPVLLIAVELYYNLFEGRKLAGGCLGTVCSLLYFLLFPLLAVGFLDFGTPNSCCGDTAFFSPDHRLTVYTLMALVFLSYFILSGSRVLPPLLQVFANCFLLVGLAFSVPVIYQLQSQIWIFIILPMQLLMLRRLFLSHQQFVQSIRQEDDQTRTGLQALAVGLLSLPAWKKFPVLVLICVPVLSIIMSFLLLFGQRPDSIVRAFTDTYRQGLSEITHECDDVVCEGHYLCTIAARGHKNIVQPLRHGVRHGQRIICNRQLLVANAFEEWLSEACPPLHKWIRKKYNVVGDAIRKHYHLFRYAWISDMVYILMKPAEWFFLIVLYLVDVRPENRIARQYTGTLARVKIIEE